MQEPLAFYLGAGTSSALSWRTNLWRPILAQEPLVPYLGAKTYSAEIRAIMPIDNRGAIQRNVQKLERDGS